MSKRCDCLLPGSWTCRLPTPLLADYCAAGRLSTRDISSLVNHLFTNWAKPICQKAFLQSQIKCIPARWQWWYDILFYEHTSKAGISCVHFRAEQESSCYSHCFGVTLIQSVENTPQYEGVMEQTCRHSVPSSQMDNNWIAIKMVRSFILAIKKVHSF